MGKRTINLTEYNIDIDSLLDVYNEVQREAGIDTGLVENDVMIDRDGTPTLVKSSNSSESKCHECQKCEDKPDKQEIGFVNRLGSFSDFKSPEIDDDDDDDTYICEYCSEIGCDHKFIPYLCETCAACEECAEYSSGDCSGCTYSRYRTGRPYSVELKDKGEVVPVSEEDIELLNVLQSDDVNDRLPVDKGFSIADYDHNY